MNHDTDPSLNCPECQGRSPFLDFHQDGLGFDLPRNHYRCPLCGYQWEMAIVEPARFIRIDGEVLVIPAKRTRAPIEHPTL